jgi:hypothetical protein
MKNVSSGLIISVENFQVCFAVINTVEAVNKTSNIRDSSRQAKAAPSILLEILTSKEK